MAKKQRKVAPTTRRTRSAKKIVEEETDASSHSDAEEQMSNADHDDDEQQVDEDSSDDSSSSDEDDEEESDEEEDVAAALFSGSSKQQNNDTYDVDESNDDEDEDHSEHAAAQAANQAAADIAANASTAGPFTFDLRNMLAISTDQLATSSLYKNTKQQAAKKPGRDEADISIPLDPTRNAIQVNEDYLLQQATTGCTQLIRALWQLPTEQSDAGPLVTLPTYDEVRLPRALVSAVFNIIVAGSVTFSFSYYLSNLLSSAATTTSKTGNQMGKVCQSQGHSSQQGETIEKSV